MVFLRLLGDRSLVGDAETMVEVRTALEVGVVAGIDNSSSEVSAD